MTRLARAALPCLVLLAACQPGANQTGSTLAGAAAGGLVGSQFGSGAGGAAMTGLGALLGALAGSDVGKRLDDADRALIEQRTRTVLDTGPAGQAQDWRNPDSGNHGTITPVRTLKRPDGAYCREYQQTVTVAGRTEQAYGTACRQLDGSWKIVS
jgi:surface antigen